MAEPTKPEAEKPSDTITAAIMIAMTIGKATEELCRAINALTRVIEKRELDS
jgi:hypothetical protein